MSNDKSLWPDDLTIVTKANAAWVREMLQLATINGDTVVQARCRRITRELKEHGRFDLMEFHR